MSLYKSAIHNIPRPLLIRFSYVFRVFANIFYRGSTVECTVCSKSFRKFLPYGSEKVFRENVLCPNCLSLERHRLLWMYLQRNTQLFSEGGRMLHIAPEQCFYGRFKKITKLDYVTGDLESPLAEFHFDLHQVPFDDNSFDFILCNHVMEHVKDDLECMKQLYRVLKPGGWAIMQVPIDHDREETLEDPSIKTPEDREKYYWQKDHLRLYGLDYPLRLEKAGFKVKQDSFVLDFTKEQLDKYRLQKEEVIYFAQKENPTHE